MKKSPNAAKNQTAKDKTKRITRKPTTRAASPSRTRIVALEAELRQRTAELAIINSIQHGLASKLDFQAIVDLVGDKLREVFNTRDFAIRRYDEKTNLVHYLYEYEHGTRLDIPPQTPSPGGTFELFLTDRQPIIGNTAEIAARTGGTVIAGTDMSKSMISVPIVSSDRLIGSFQIENYERENAYGESELRLLTTIAASLGTALENARLFDETQRLLKITEERNAELAIINSVQAALAAELNIQGIYNAVGDKIREIFNQADVGIRIYDPKTNQVQYPYVYENGARIEIPSNSLSMRGFASHVIRTRETIVINENMAQAMEQYGSFTIPGTEESKSALYVPLVVGEQARGLIDIVDTQREHAFSESDVRLLQTLANSMSVALENARLFDETQRLLKITEERNAELAIINSVQAALAAELNIQGIYQAVGDKVREIFNNADVGIRIYDPKTNLVHYPYAYEGGVRVTIDSEPLPARGIAPHVIRTRETIVINENIRQVAEHYGSHLLPGTEMPKSQLFVPLVTGNQARGIIDLVDMNQENAFSESDVRLLQTLANSMSVALENARLFDETQRLLKETEQRAAELAIINSVQQGLASKLDMQAIYDLVGEKIRDMFSAQSVIISSFDHAKQVSQLDYGYEEGQRVYDDELLAFSPMNDHLIRTRQPVVINENARQESQRYGLKTIEGTRLPKSLVYVPFGVGNQVNGYFSLQNFDNDNAFTESDVRLLQTLAGSMGIALENARLFDETTRLLQETEQRAQELAIINSVQQGLASKLEMQAIYDLVGDKIQSIFDAQVVDIGLYDRDAHLFHFLYTIERGVRFPDEPMQVIGFRKHVIETRQPLLINEKMIEVAAQYGNPIAFQGEAAISALYVPMIVGNQARGVISLQNLDHENAFSESDMRLLETFVNSMSVALENARLLDETTRRANEMTALTDIGREISASLDLNIVLERVTQNAQKVLRASTSAVYLIEPDGKTLRAISASGATAEAVLEFRPQLGQGLIGSIAQNGVAEAIADTTLDTRTIHLPGTGPTAKGEKLMVAPLFSANRLSGAIAAWRDAADESFAPDDLTFLDGMARQAGIAIQNARLFDDSRRLLNETNQRAAELEIINRIQQGLASQLDFQGIIDLVGAKFHEIFGPPTMVISLFEPATNRIEHRYIVERGQRFPPESESPPDPLRAEILRTRAALVINENFVEYCRALGMTDVLVGETPKSWLGVPILSGDQVIGIISLQDLDRENAFDESVTRLLTTITSSMSVAFQNARLFDETNRLLSETKQRAAELQIINSVQQGLASQLNYQAVVELVGNKIHEIFSAETMMISVFDAAANRMDHLYLLERGERFASLSETPPDALRAQILNTRHSLVINANFAERCAALGMTDVIAGESPKSWLGVPISRGEQVAGIISL